MEAVNCFRVANRTFELGMKPREFTVYCCLLRHADKDNRCFPSRRCISRESNISIKTVDSALNNLINMGLIEKISRKRADGSKSSNVYYIANLLEQRKN